MPQHFLAAWAKNKQLFRYRYIEEADRFECKKSTIRRTASVESLYDINLPDGAFEIESSIITPKLDEIGYKALDQARSIPLSGLTNEVKKDLAFYLTCLEARNPEILEAMSVSDEDFKKIKGEVERASRSSQESIDEVFSYIGKSTSKGVMALALFVTNELSGVLEKPFHHGLLNSNAVEFNFPENCLITSDYPTFRMDHYHREVLFCVAISPKKALIYSKNEFANVVPELPVDVQADFINVLTLAKAKFAYSYSSEHESFIENHLGWALADSSQHKIQEYISNFLGEALR